MRITSDHVRVTVPATAGNLGPGFDALGMALGVTDTIDVRALASAEVVIEITGEGAGEIPTDETHLMVRALRAALDHVGASQTGLHLTAHNSIPQARGLGSSAAAVVAGIVAARGMIDEPEALNNAVALELATQFEGHPDNAAPAIYGGATAAWMDGMNKAHAVPVTVAETLETAVLIPTSILATAHARSVLPDSVPHADAAFNLGRAALLVATLAGNDGTVNQAALVAATEDKLHQHYRATSMPAAMEMMRTLRDKGLAAVVSGAGPSVLVMGQGLGAAGFASGAAAWADGIGGETWHVVHTVGPVTGASVTAL